MIRLPYAYPKTSKSVKTKTYDVSFRKQNTNELKTGQFSIGRGELKGVISIFAAHGWNLIKIKGI
jgi:hypothetical protein